MDKKKLGQRIREERLKRHLTQEIVAENLDISVSYMGQIERGERSLTVETLVNLANLLGVTVDYLLIDSMDLNDDELIIELAQLLEKRSASEKLMALDILRIMFSHLDKQPDL